MIEKQWLQKGHYQEAHEGHQSSSIGPFRLIRLSLDP